MTEVMPVPDVAVDGARRDAERLRRAARLAAVAVEQVAGTQPTQWYGRGETAADGARARLARQADDVRRLTRSVSLTIDTFADATESALSRMRSAAGELEHVLARRAAMPDDPHAATLVELAWEEYRAGERAYGMAVEAATAALREVPLSATSAAQGPGRHGPAALRRFWDDAVVGPASLGWVLTTGWVSDGQAWRTTVRETAGAAADAVRDPTTTLDEMLAGPDWRAGEWGAAAGGLAAALVPSRRLLASPDTRARYRHNMADRSAPVPRVQRLEEMLVRVDLGAHEHATLGHTLRRHVDVDDDYLRDRLAHGTLLDDGTRGFPPGAASAWASREVAEETITETLRRNESLVREWLAERSQKSLSVGIAVDPGVGRVISRRGGDLVLHQPSRSRVLLVREGDVVHVHTAYLEAP